jgi:hypothetical protein
MPDISFPILRPLEVQMIHSKSSFLKTVFAVSAVFLSCTTAGFADDQSPQLRPGLGAGNSTKSVRPNRIRKDRAAANSMARYHWLDRAAMANPQLIESITDFHSASMLLTKHPRLGEIAEADHYLCRRLTRWKDVARKLAANPECDKVIARDPEGIYRAIKRDRRLAKILARNPMFHRMIGENPDLGKLLSTYM